MAFSALLVLVSSTSASALLQSNATGHGKPLIDKINFFRCEMCAHQCPDSGAYPKCKDFMTKICNPGEDGKMDGSPGERTTGQGWCTEFFNSFYEVCHPELKSQIEAQQAVPAPGPAPAIPVLVKAHTPQSVDHSMGEREVKALSRMDKQEIFGVPGQPDYISTEEIDTMSGEEITEEEKKVEPMLHSTMPLLRDHLKVQGPLPFGFRQMFVNAIVEAVPSCHPEMIKIEQLDKYDNGVRQIMYRAPQKVLDEIRDQIVDPHSKLINGPMKKFLIKRSHYQKVNVQEAEWRLL